MPVIRMLLSLSTGHLPHDLGASGLSTAPSVVAYRTDYGWLMWIPDDPAESVTATSDRVPDVVLAIQRYARALGCDYVLFDADADRIDELPFWNW